MSDCPQTFASFLRTILRLTCLVRLLQHDKQIYVRLSRLRQRLPNPVFGHFECLAEGGTKKGMIGRHQGTRGGERRFDEGPWGQVQKR
jgi:hypothetical protein